MIIRLFLLLALTMNCYQVWAVTETFNYTGILANSQGQTVVGESRINITARLFENAVGGQAGFIQTFNNILVKDGLFTIEIGPQLPDRSVFKYLELEVNGSTLAPRVKPRGVPVAEDSEKISGMTTTQLLSNFQATLLPQIQDNSGRILNLEQNVAGLTSSPSNDINTENFFSKSEINIATHAFSFDGTGIQIQLNSVVGENEVTKFRILNALGNEVFSIGSNGGVSALQFMGDGSRLTGIQSFDSLPTFPLVTPTLSNHAVSKAYIDSLFDNLGNLSNQNSNNVVITGGTIVANSYATVPTGMGTHFSVNSSGVVTASTYHGDGSKLLGVLTSIPSNAVTSLQIESGAVTFSKLADGAVSGAKLGSDVVRTMGSQQISGIKTFNSLPDLPLTSPIFGTQAVSKFYLETRLANFYSMAYQASSSVNITGGQIKVNSLSIGGVSTNYFTVNSSGIVTATTYYGDGSKLQGIVTSILPGSINTSLISSNAITIEKLANGAATGLKLGTDVVKTYGSQTIEGVKSFSSLPVLTNSTPSLTTHAASKGYVDTKVDSLGSMAFQTASSVTINGGTINGTSLGLSIASSATVSDLIVSGSIRLVSGTLLNCSQEGLIRYNPDHKRVEFCDGTSYRSISGEVYTTSRRNVFGGSLDDVGGPIVINQRGNIVIAGNSKSSDGDVHINRGNKDFWIFEMDSQRKILWETSYGGSLEDFPSDMILASDGGYVIAGRTRSNDGNISLNKGSSDFWVIKTDSIGSLIWETSLGGSGIDHAVGITATSDGGYVVVGESTSGDGDRSTSKGNYDAWIVRLSSTGSIVWETSFGGSGNDKGYGITPSGDGGFVIAAEAHSSDGDPQLANPSAGEAWIFKIDSTGNLVWQTSFGGSAWDLAYTVVQASDGGFVVGGWTESGDRDVTNNYGSNDFWLIKVNSIGSLVWQTTIGSSGSESPVGNLIESNGSFVFAGASGSSDGLIGRHFGSSDAFVGKVDGNGNFLWGEVLGGSQYDYANGLAVFQNQIIISGWSDEATDGMFHGNRGNKDAFVFILKEELRLVE